MVRLKRCGQFIKMIVRRKRKNAHLHQFCPLCETHYNQGLHRPCIDICNGEKCLNCIIKLKKCARCPPERKSCGPSSPSSSSPLIVESTLSLKLEETAASSPKKEEDVVTIPKIEAITVKELKVEELQPQLPQKLIGEPLGEEFPENVRFIPGKDRRHYYCTICESRWTTKQNKKAHDHGKPKPFRCHLCITATTGQAKEFTERTHFNYHMKSAHGIHNQPVRKATKVNKMSSTRSRSKLLTSYFKCYKNRQLRKAKVVTSPTANALTVNSQVKPFKCPKCPTRFTRRDNMTTHLRNTCNGRK